MSNFAFAAGMLARALVVKRIFQLRGVLLLVAQNVFEQAPSCRIRIAEIAQSDLRAPMSRNNTITRAITAST